MSNQRVKVQLKTFGSFDCLANGKRPNFVFNTETKLAQAFIIMCLAGESGLSRPDFARAVFGGTDSADINRLKNLLVELCKVASEELDVNITKILSYNNGNYCFGSAIDVDCDAVSFEKLCAKADTEGDGKKRERTLISAVNLYEGKLVHIPGCESWVNSKADSLHSQYINAVNQLGKIYDNNKLYLSEYEMFSKALKLAPFNEEIIIGLVESLKKQGKLKEALTAYQEATEVLTASLGQYPSEKLISVLRDINKHLMAAESTVELREAENACGATYFNYPDFRVAREAILAIMKRENIPGILLRLKVVTNSAEQNISKRDAIQALSDLHIAINKSLRSSDIFTTSAGNEMMILLWNTTEDYSGLIISRINERFIKEKGNNPFSLRYRIDSGDAPLPSPQNAK